MSDSFASDDVVDIMAAFLSVFQGPHLRQLNWCLRSPQLLGPLWDPLGYLQRGAFQLLQWLLLNSLLWVSWEAGQALTPQLSLQPRIYVVPRAKGIPEPCCFRNSRSYWFALCGSHGSSVSHSFPSEMEARIYRWRARNARVGACNRGEKRFLFSSGDLQRRRMGTSKHVLWLL